ncbi:MAG: tyrosine-type recombinase/integrase [Candidatus Rokubacteria bacterium]|nr:tyrosine-type recombinase/integrase [Candidatus Rokubacteria bacterium]
MPALGISPPRGRRQEVETARNQHFLVWQFAGAWLWRAKRAKRRRPGRPGVADGYLLVLTRDATQAVLERLDGVPRLMALLLYGAGIRLLECCHLRIKDVDSAANRITIRDGKGSKDRIIMLPGAAVPERRQYLARVPDAIPRQHGRGPIERHLDLDPQASHHDQRVAARTPRRRTRAGAGTRGP